MVKDCTSVIEEAELYQESAEEAVARLAALPPLEYGRCRKEEAKRMDVRVTDLDSAVKEQRRIHELMDAEEELALPEPEPWHEVVDGQVLLDELVAVLRRYVVLPDGAAEAMALWVLHTHTIESAEITPRLALLSPEKRCGKTLALNMLQKLVWRPLPASNVTPAAVFRAVDAASPTLLIDEADSFLKDNHELRGILNSGHCRGMAFVIRAVGEDHEPRQFSTFAPVALAAIGRIPGTLEDRSIIIRMHRRKHDERVERFRMDRTPELDKLARMAARWARDNKEDLADADPFIPEELHDRAADNWRSLLGIADLAGGEWPKWGRVAALHISSEQETDDSSVGVQLLTDIAGLFATRSTDRLPSQDICKALSVMEHRPWPEYRNGQTHHTPPQVAKLLKPFGVRPKQVRVEGRGMKGYMKHDLDDDFARYVPSPAETPKQAGVFNSLEEKLPGTVLHDVSDEKDGKTSRFNDVSDVSDRTEGVGAELSLFEQDG